MRKLDHPPFTVRDVLDQAVRQAHQPRRTKLQTPGLEGSLVVAETVYAVCMRASAASSIPKSSDIAGVLNEGEAKYVYDSLRRLKYGGMTMADAIFRTARFGKCAYCGHGAPIQLDHYLPRSSYVEYSFCPLNLVPACANCNSTAFKGANPPAGPQDTFFHPYYDNPDDGRWLFVNMTVGSDGLEVKFDVQRPAGWPIDKYQRVAYTFRKLRLSKVYAQDVISEISARRDVLGKIFKSAAAAGLQSFFAEQGAQYASDNPNAWIRVAYEYLSKTGAICSAFPDWLK